MKPVRIVSVLLALSCLPALAAEDGAKLIAKYNCLGCHATDHKIVGPAYKDVAARYRGQKGAEAMLMQEVRAGTKGKWGGPVAMPPQQISDADLKVIVQWILAQK
ncbi:c-type cytochrome [Jeongeupia chitinilytica]|uniref:Cytochrome c-551 n=1 Tax=Jeongeupia chitinilytica TaxID=1041641 RepID=A0ABQ3H137_9NEIS|nr:c-type cytochrome [Jeongeupia chitinilytica]GHD65054.1 cytochrome c-551 [Jeongeupia chitinilytica]